MRQGEKNLDKLSDVRYTIIHSCILNFLFIFFVFLFFCLFFVFFYFLYKLFLQKYTGRIAYRPYVQFIIVYTMFP